MSGIIRWKETRSYFKIRLLNEYNSAGRVSRQSRHKIDPAGERAPRIILQLSVRVREEGR